MSKKVLCLLTDGFEEIEVLTPIDLLRRAGAEVTLAAVLAEPAESAQPAAMLQVIGRSGVVLLAETALEDVLENAAAGGQAGDEPGAVFRAVAARFDLLLLPGGPGVETLRADGRPARLAAAFAEAGKPVAAICAAPTVLKDAGLLAGRRYTAHFSVEEELANPQAGLAGSLPSERVVVDATPLPCVVTSRGAGTALDFGLALVRLLFGGAAEAEVAESIMA
jgi:4-methyl-5(b-hydroxyethyl)-thiazole monophosphate biosynthesis